jgi:hypothetical protein
MACKPSVPDSINVPKFMDRQPLVSLKCEDEKGSRLAGTNPGD